MKVVLLQASTSGTEAYGPSAYCYHYYLTLSSNHTVLLVVPTVAMHHCCSVAIGGSMEWYCEQHGCGPLGGLLVHGC
jgi:hypothetical protein